MRFLVAFSICVSFALSAQAQSFSSPSPAVKAWVDPGWRRPVAREIDVFEENGLAARSFELEYLALDERGARAIAQGVYGYNSYFSDLTIIEAATVKADGRVIAVDANAIKDQDSGTNPASPYFDEYRIRLVAYPDVQPGDRIRIRWKTVDKSAILPGEFASAWREPLSAPPSAFELTVDLPRKRDVQIREHNVDHTVAEVGNRKLHHVVFKHDTPLPWSPDIDRLEAMPRFEISTFTDYAAFAAVIDARNAPMSVADATIAKLSNEIVGDTTDSRAKAEKIHNWVAKNIRYVGIGLKDGGFTSQPAPAVLTARYGDCKAHASILKALLAAQGIEANLVLINADRSFVLTELATPNFDHAIIYLPAFDLYLDPTASHVAFGSLPAVLYGKPVLNVDRRALATIPPLRPEAFTLDTTTDFVLGADGQRKAHSVFAGVGVGATVRRSVANYLEGVDRREKASQRLKDWELSGTGDYQFANPRDLANWYSVTADFEVLEPVALNTFSRIRMLPFTAVGPKLSNLISDDARGRAFQCFPMIYRENASLKLPQGTHVAEKPGDFKLEKSFKGDTAFGSVEGRITIIGTVTYDGETLKLERIATFDFNAPVCPASFGDELDQAFARWDKQRMQQVALTPGPVSRVVETGSSFSDAVKAYHERSFATALSEFRPLAEQGDREAQRYLAIMYRDGSGAAQDFKQAFQWFEKAANSGDALAQANLGYLYEVGKGTYRSFPSAAVWYEKAAGLGNTYAQHRLGLLYEYGSGVEKNFDRAIALHMRAAEQGSKEAQYRLGEMYLVGRGVSLDFAAALKWYQKAADQGYAPAQFAVGRMYERGLGTPKDLAKATAAFTKAAAQGHDRARAKIAEIVLSTRDTGEQLGNAAP